MPDTAQDEYDHHVDVPTALRPTVSAKRYIKIIAEPRSKRNMPTPPEVPDGISEIWASEIGNQLITKDSCRTYSNVGVSREIAVYLEGIQIKSDQYGQSYGILLDY